jgi:glycosyltransferase involved in cell wall biosynthesis
MDDEPFPTYLQLMNIATSRIAWITRREIVGGEELPSNHAWGTDFLFSLGATRVPTRHIAWIDRIGEKLRFGPNVSEQIWLFFNRRKYDFIIAKDTDLITILCGLLWLFRQRKDMFAFLHFPLRVSIKDFFLAKRCGVLLALSEKIRTLSLISYPAAAESLVTLRWGVDIEFYDRLRARLGTSAASDDKLRILLIGITGRKFNAFVEAVGDDPDIEVRVLTGSADVVREIARLPNFRSIRENLDKPVPYPDLVANYLACDLVAIPLDMKRASDAELIRHRATLWGITTLLEASALSKPVVMTFNPVIDFDVVGQQCGLFIHDDDAAHWREGIQKCKASRAALPSMGALARLHAETDYDMREFQKQLRAIIESLP